MKSRSVLLVFGVVCLFVVELAAVQFIARAESPLVRPDYMLARVRVSEISIGILVHTVAGGLVGGLGSFLLFLYFKIKDLEINVKELRVQNHSIRSAGSLGVHADSVADLDLEQPHTNQRRAYRLAIVGLMLSCSGVVLGPLGCLAGIACGHLAKREIRKYRSLRGARIAAATLIIGYTLLVLNIVLGITAIIYIRSL